MDLPTSGFQIAQVLAWQRFEYEARGLTHPIAPDIPIRTGTFMGPTYLDARRQVLESVFQAQDQQLARLRQRMQAERG